MNDKIMTMSSLEHIVARLDCCHSLLDAIRWAMEGKDKTLEDSIFAVSDLLEAICRDFQTDIDAADEVTI